MKLILEPTTMLGDIMIKGVRVPARIWMGKTEKGTQCFVFIVRIAVEDGKEEEFQRELIEIPTKVVPPEGLPIRLFID